MPVQQLAASCARAARECRRSPINDCAVLQIHPLPFLPHHRGLGPAPMLPAACLEVRSFVGAFKRVNNLFLEKVCALAGSTCAPAPEGPAMSEEDAMALGKEIFKHGDHGNQPGEFIDLTPVHEILPRAEGLGGLFMGDIHAARDAPFLTANGVTLLVQCAAELSQGQTLAPVVPEGVRVLDLGLKDQTFEGVEAALALALPAIVGARKAGGSVLVNCHAGRSRSGCVVLAHLMSSQEWSLKDLSLKDAWLFLKKQRPQAAPHFGYFLRLMAREVRSSGVPSIPPMALTQALRYAETFRSKDGEGRAFITKTLDLARHARPASALLARHIAAGKAFSSIAVQVVRNWCNFSYRPSLSCFSLYFVHPPNPFPGVGSATALSGLALRPQEHLLPADGHGYPWHTRP